MAVQTLLQPKSFTDQVWASCAFQNESARETFREPVWVGVGEGAGPTPPESIIIQLYGLPVNKDFEYSAVVAEYIRL